MSNLVFKGAAVAVLGTKKLLAYVAITFGITLACGLALLFAWPDIPIPTQWLTGQSS